jgi:hypothetical protein
MLYPAAKMQVEGCPATYLSLQQLQDLAASVGFPDPALAAAVAMAESSGNTGVEGDVTLGVSVGLWQINLAAHPQYADNPQALCDPIANAQAAYSISSGGKNWTPWSAYNHGLYKKWYQQPIVPTPSPAPAPASLSTMVSRFTPAQAIVISAGLVGAAALAAYAIIPEVEREWPRLAMETRRRRRR